MTRPSFARKREDGRLAGEVLAEYLAGRLAAHTLKNGDLVSHDELAAELDLERDEDGTWPSEYYQAVQKAALLLESQNHRSLKNVRGTGYKIAAGMESIRVSKTRQRRAGKQIALGLHTANSVDMRDVPPEQHALARAVQAGMTALAAVAKVQAEKLAEHDRLIEHLAEARVKDRATTTLQQDQIADLFTRMEKLEAERDAAAGVVAEEHPPGSRRYTTTPPHMRNRTGGAA